MPQHALTSSSIFLSFSFTRENTLVSSKKKIKEIYIFIGGDVHVVTESQMTKFTLLV